MSEFMDVCRQMRKICRAQDTCAGCPMELGKFCQSAPCNWHDKTLTEVELTLAWINGDSISYGEYLEKLGVISPDSDDQTKLKLLYQTKVPMEWVK